LLLQDATKRVKKTQLEGVIISPLVITIDNSKYLLLQCIGLSLSRLLKWTRDATGIMFANNKLVEGKYECWRKYLQTQIKLMKHFLKKPSLGAVSQIYKMH